MPVTGIRHSFDLATRNAYTKVSAELGLKLDGKELPNMAVLGEAVEKAVEMIQEHIKKSYEVVPERHGDTPLGTPAVVGSGNAASLPPGATAEPAKVPDF